MANLSFSQPYKQNYVSGPDTGPRSRNDHRETDENYKGELFRNGIFRVSVCRDGIQWLFQRQRPQFPPGGAAWDTLGYCVSKSGLTRLVRAQLSGEAAEFEALLEDFPMRFRSG